MQQSFDQLLHLVIQHVGSDADVEANTKLKGLEEKLAAVGQNISLRVKVKESEDEDEEEEQIQHNGEDAQLSEQYRVPQNNGDLPLAGTAAATRHGVLTMHFHPFVKYGL